MQVCFFRESVPSEDGLFIEIPPAKKIITATKGKPSSIPIRKYGALPLRRKKAKRRPFAERGNPNPKVTSPDTPSASNTCTSQARASKGQSSGDQSSGEKVGRNFAQPDKTKMKDVGQESTTEEEKITGEHAETKTSTTSQKGGPTVINIDDDDAPETTKEEEKITGEHTETKTSITSQEGGPTVINIDDNAPDPTPWMQYRNVEQGINILLYQQTKEHILDPHAWLMDSEIHAAQQLLKLKFSFVDGLVDPAIRGSLVTPANTEFVQIVNTGSHWVCMSSISCPMGTVKVYDSLYNSPSTTAVEHVCRMLHHQGEKVTVASQKVQKQTNSDDCGLFAIAFATTLCYGEDPTKTRYEQSTMRRHLVDCIEGLEMTLFPETTMRVPWHDNVRERIVPIFCLCRMPNDNKEYVQCTGCKQWYHPGCAKVPDSARSKRRQRWFCHMCESP